MRFRDVSSGRSLQRPSIDMDDLVEEDAGFRGEFAYEDTRFTGGDQAGVVGEGTLRRCLVAGVDVSDARLSPVDLTDVGLTGVDLSNATVGVGIARRVEWEHCRGMGLRLGLERVEDFYAQDCRLDYATVEMGRVKGLAVFQGCSLREAVISGDLSSVLFLDCDLTGAEFAARRAEGCDLRGSRLDGVRGLVSLRGARIHAEQVVSVAEVLAAETGLVIER